MRFVYNVLMAITYDVKVFKCDVCGHRWLPEGNIIPPQCPSRRCRSRRWNYLAEPAASAVAIHPHAAPVQPASAPITVPSLPSASSIRPLGRVPRCPIHRLPMVRNDETGFWRCRVTKCRHQADDEMVQMAYDTADFATTV